MINGIYEVVKEFKTSIDGLNFEIKGRILKRVMGDKDIEYSFKWEISHYYKQYQNSVEAYHPSGTYAATYERAEYMLFFYMKPFTNIGVEINPYY